MLIPVIINNRDLLTWPKAMVKKIKTYTNVGEIIIVDNGSTYPPLLEWYDSDPCTIIKCSNLGHAGAWISGIVDKLECEYYVVTDSDLGLENTPEDTLVRLRNAIISSNLDKVGLGLDWEIVEPKSPYYNRLNLYERDRWKHSRIEDDDIYLDVAIDTTFSLYRWKHYFIGGASLAFPYIARHHPWELSIKEAQENEEFKYYIDNASQSCSYKHIVQL